MNITRRDLINQTLRILDLQGGSRAPEVDAVDGNPANQVYTSDVTLTDFLNEAAAVCAQTCLPLWDAGTKASFTGGAAYYTDLVVTSGNRIWAIEGNGVRLGTARVIRGEKQFVDSNSATGTSDSPFLYWYPLGQTGLTVVGTPTPASATLAVSGLAVPKPVAVDADVFPASWLKPEDAYTLCLYTAARVAEKRAADGILGQRQAELWGKFAARQAMHRATLTDTERALMLASGDGVPHA